MLVHYESAKQKGIRDLKVASYKKSSFKSPCRNRLYLPGFSPIVFIPYYIIVALTWGLIMLPIWFTDQNSEARNH